MDSLMSFQKSGVLFGLNRLCTLNYPLQTTGALCNYFSHRFREHGVLGIPIPSFQDLESELCGASVVRWKSVMCYSYSLASPGLYLDYNPFGCVSTEVAGVWEDPRK